MPINDEICRMNARALAAQIKRKRIKPIEAVDAVLARMERLEPALHAFCTPTPDLARAQARRLATRIARGGSIGALAGVPISIKDLIFTKGIRTASGSFAYRDFVPEEDDIVVERLRAADAIIIGKTNVSEFGYSATGHNPLFETTRNPWNLAMTPGGSSAGAGVAVATGMGPVAIGSDGGGSVRIPAAHCGVFGMKPSMGRIPLYPGARDERFPGASGWESLECYGPLSRSVADSALILSVVAGPDPRDRHSIPTGDVNWMRALSGNLRGKRVGYCEDWGYAAVDPEVREIVRAAVRVFEKDLKCVVEEARPGWDDPAPAFAAIITAETDLRGMREMIAVHGSRMSSHLVDWMSREWKAEDFTDANIARKAVANRMWRMMARYDFLLTPTLAVPPFPVHMQGPEKIGGRYVRPEAWLAFTFPMNLTGQPAASVPAGWTRDGLPGGLADRRTPSRRRDGAAGVGGIRRRAPMGGSLARARASSVRRSRWRNYTNISTRSRNTRSGSICPPSRFGLRFRECLHRMHFSREINGIGNAFIGGQLSGVNGGKWLLILKVLSPRCPRRHIRVSLL